MIPAAEREVRRALAERDAAVLEAHPEDDDLDALVEWTAKRVRAGGEPPFSEA